MDRLYRWVWDQEDGYTAHITPDHADAWLRHLAQRDTSAVDKSTHRKAAMMLMKWRHHKHGTDKWDPAFTFSTPAAGPRDFLTRDERKAIREAAYEYGAVPAYSTLTPAQRDRWKSYLAQRFEKPKADVTRADWDRANGWKIPSLVWVSLDAGLRPIEVERAVTDWVDLENGVLRIPREDSSKNRADWIVGLKHRTAHVLERWLEQRDAYEEYDDTRQLWLTREANPYSSASLRYVLHRLCEIAGIDTENRKMSWYSIRHSTGTYMTREEDLAAAQTQLRHLRPETTMKYDQTPVEDRQDALDRMG
jgi:site-specific recombinase XerD